MPSRPCVANGEKKLAPVPAEVSPEDVAFDQLQAMVDAGRAEEASSRLQELLRQFAQSPMAWQRASGLRAQQLPDAERAVQFTLAEALAERIDHCVMLDGDHLVAVNSPQADEAAYLQPASEAPGHPSR